MCLRPAYMSMALRLKCLSQRSSPNDRETKVGQDRKLWTQKMFMFDVRRTARSEVLQLLNDIVQESVRGLQIAQTTAANDLQIASQAPNIHARSTQELRPPRRPELPDPLHQRPIHDPSSTESFALSSAVCSRVETARVLQHRSQL